MAFSHKRSRKKIKEATCLEDLVVWHGWSNNSKRKVRGSYVSTKKA